MRCCTRARRCGSGTTTSARLSCAWWRSPSVDSDIETRDLTPAPARALDEQSFVVSPDGRTVITGWAVDDEPGFPRPQLVAIDVATGEHRVLASEPYVFFADPAFSPDGRRIACLRVEDSSYDEAPRPSSVAA